MTIDSNSLGTPTDNIFVISRLGQMTGVSNALADFDENGLMTPTDAISFVDGIGYSINKSIFE